MRGFLQRVVFLIAVLVLFYSGYQLAKIERDYKEDQKGYEELRKEVISKERGGLSTVDKEGVVVDFAMLKAMNSDIVGWIRIPGTRVNYPILRGVDNEKYLHRDFYGNPSKAGAIFTDCRNEAPFDVPLTVVYGHNMKDGSMFHDLLRFRKQSFVNQYDEIFIYRLDGSVEVYQVFSAHITEANSDCYVLRGSVEEYVEEQRRASEVVFSNDNQKGEKLIMLSTCYGDERMVIKAMRLTHASLGAGKRKA